MPVIQTIFPVNRAHKVAGMLATAAILGGYQVDLVVDDAANSRVELDTSHATKDDRNNIYVNYRGVIEYGTMKWSVADYGDAAKFLFGTDVIELP